MKARRRLVSATETGARDGSEGADAKGKVADAAVDLVAAHGGQAPAARGVAACARRALPEPTQFSALVLLVQYCSLLQRRWGDLQHSSISKLECGARHCALIDL